MLTLLTVFQNILIRLVFCLFLLFCFVLFLSRILLGKNYFFVLLDDKANIKGKGRGAILSQNVCEL